MSLRKKINLIITLIFIVVNLPVSGKVVEDDLVGDWKIYGLSSDIENLYDVESDSISFNFENTLVLKLTSNSFSQEFTYEYNGEDLSLFGASSYSTIDRAQLNDIVQYLFTNSILNLKLRFISKDQIELSSWEYKGSIFLQRD